MSIEKRAGTMSRSFRSLIKTRAALANAIKDLKDLRAFCVWAAIDIKVLQTLRARETLFFASRGGLSPASGAWRGTGPRPTVKGYVPDTVARGACPPRSFQAPSGFPRDRSMARDRPSRYGKRRRSGYRSAGACPPRSFQAPSGFPSRSLHGEGQALALR